MEEKQKNEEEKQEQIKEMGSISLEENNRRNKIKLLTIIGEIEGHEAVSGSRTFDCRDDSVLK